MWKKWLQISLWGLLGCGCIVLLVAAVQVKNNKLCSGIVVDIDSNGEKAFISEKDITEVLQKNGVVKGAVLSDVHPWLVEAELEKNAWIRDAQLFFDNNQVLTVKIAERLPIARMFAVDGSSFYIDTAGNKLPLSDKFSVRVPVFTSYPANKKGLTAQDSVIVADVKHIAQYIQQDSFFTAQVGQVDIMPNGTYQVIPVIGNQVIKLGNGDDIAGKFSRLYAFYKQVWSKTGFEKYDTVDVQYAGQVVAARRGESSTPVIDTTAANPANAATVTAARADSLHMDILTRMNNVRTDSTVVNRRMAARLPRHTAVTPAAGNKRPATHVPPKRNVRRTGRH